MEDMFSKLTIRFSLWYETLRTIDTVFIVLLILKLFKVHPVVSVSWLWITAPVWIPMSLIFLLAVVCYGPLLVRFVVGWFKDKFGKGGQTW